MYLFIKKYFISLLFTAFVLPAFIGCSANKPGFTKSKIKSYPREATAEKSLAWYQAAKFGMFIHWSLPAIDGEEMWFRYNKKISDEVYRKLPARFNPTKFDAAKWVKVAKDAGMKWIVITAKHHDGFAIYDSKADEFDIKQTPFGKSGRDPLKELAAECKKQGIKLGFYYSHYQDWDHPGGGKARQSYKDKMESNFDDYLNNKAIPQVKELLTNYGDILTIWYDTPMHASETDVEKFRAVVHKTSPQTLIGGRLDDATGDYWSIPDLKVPQNPFSEPWETCSTTSQGWGWSGPNKPSRSAAELIEELCIIVSRGGNLLLNTGPSPTGEMNQNDVKAFAEIGKWLQSHKESIYGTDMNPYYDTDYTCTQKDNNLYFHLFGRNSEEPFLIKHLESDVKKMYLLNSADKKELYYDKQGGTYKVTIPQSGLDKYNTVLVVETVGKPEVINDFPKPDNNGKLIVPANKFSIVDKPFSQFDEASKLLLIKDSRRSWQFFSVKIEKAGDYYVAVNHAKVDSGTLIYTVHAN